MLPLPRPRIPGIHSVDGADWGDGCKCKQYHGEHEQRSECERVLVELVHPVAKCGNRSSVSGGCHGYGTNVPFATPNTEDHSVDGVTGVMVQVLHYHGEHEQRFTSC